MPIYSYRCNECGFAQDVLQKVSDPLLTVCPSCSKAEFKKQVTAAGFQLKGTGWYATDFKGGSSNDAAKSGKNEATGDSTGETKTESSAPDKTASSTVAEPTKSASDSSPA